MILQSYILFIQDQRHLILATELQPPREPRLLTVGARRGVPQSVPPGPQHAAAEGHGLRRGLRVGRGAVPEHQRAPARLRWEQSWVYCEHSRMYIDDILLMNV